jgi:hypothetical protein
MRPARVTTPAALAAAIVLMLAAGGCASSKKPASTSTTSTTSTTLPTATAPASDTEGSAITTGQATLLAHQPKVAPVLEPLPAPGSPFTAPLGSDGLADPAVWPDACTILSDAQLLAIVPAAASVTAAGRPGLLGAERSTPHPATCTYSLAWRDGHAVPGTVTVELRSVASGDILAAVHGDRRAAASAAAKGHPGLFADYGTKLGGADCFYDGAVLECVDGTFTFWVGGVDPRGAPPAAEAREDQWRNRVLAKVVALLAERMTPSETASS